MDLYRLTDFGRLCEKCCPITNNGTANGDLYLTLDFESDAKPQTSTATQQVTVDVDGADESVADNSPAHDDPASQLCRAIQAYELAPDQLALAEMWRGAYGDAYTDLLTRLANAMAIRFEVATNENEQRLPQSAIEHLLLWVNKETMKCQTHALHGANDFADEWRDGRRFIALWSRCVGEEGCAGAEAWSDIDRLSKAFTGLDKLGLPRLLDLEAFSRNAIALGDAADAHLNDVAGHQGAEGEWTREGTLISCAMVRRYVIQVRRLTIHKPPILILNFS